MPNLQPGRLRGVVDASTLVGAMLRPRSVPRQAVEMLLEDYVVVLSTDILAEVTEVLRRPKFDRHAPIEDRIAFLTFFLVRTLVVEVTTEVTACRDPTDDKYLSLAVSAEADVIVSSDADLLALDPFRRIRILSPRDFLDRRL